MRKVVADVIAAARELTQDAVDTLKAAMTAPAAPWAARVSAATAILDCGWGKPGQAVEIGGEIEGALTFKLTDADRDI